MIRSVVDAARRYGRSLSICGEMASDPPSTKMLLGLGLREFSMQPRSIPAFCRTVAGIDTRLAQQEVEDEQEQAGPETAESSPPYSRRRVIPSE